MKILLPFLFIFAMSCQKEEQIVPSDDVSSQENIIITFSSGLKKSDTIGYGQTVQLERNIHSIMSAHRYPSMQPINVYWLIEWEDSYESNLSSPMGGDQISFDFPDFATYKISISKTPGGEVIFSFFAQTSGLPGKLGDNEEYNYTLRNEVVYNYLINRRELLVLVKYDQEPEFPYEAYARFDENQTSIVKLKRYKWTEYYYFHLPEADDKYVIKFLRSAGTQPLYGQIDNCTWMSSYSIPYRGIGINFPPYQ